MFHGSIPALVTPFRDDGVDTDAFAALVERQIRAGSAALVPCGTTGESATLSIQEHDGVVATCVEVAAGRTPVIAGAGSNDTRVAIAHARHAKAVGADAVLVVSPYYNKPDQAGLYAHFEAINDAVDIPVIVYNIPSRSGVDISVETLARLSRLPNIVGVKDATASLVRSARDRAACGAQFARLSGEDPTALAFLAHGGVGTISVTANVAPSLCAAFHAAALAGDYAKALELHDRLMPLHEALFCAPNPGPTKYALSRMGLCLPDQRLPLVAISDAARAQVDAAMEAVGVLDAEAQPVV